jgi:hypothetical protein
MSVQLFDNKIVLRVCGIYLVGVQYQVIRVCYDNHSLHKYTLCAKLNAVIIKPGSNYAKPLCSKLLI